MGSCQNGQMIPWCIPLLSSWRAVWCGPWLKLHLIEKDGILEENPTVPNPPVEHSHFRKKGVFILHRLCQSSCQNMPKRLGWYSIAGSCLHGRLAKLRSWNWRWEMSQNAFFHCYPKIVALNGWHQLVLVLVKCPLDWGSTFMIHIKKSWGLWKGTQGATEAWRELTWKM